jgi:hypothetical protein
MAACIDRGDLISGEDYSSSVGDLISGEDY